MPQSPQNYMRFRRYNLSNAQSTQTPSSHHPVAPLVAEPSPAAFTVATAQDTTQIARSRPETNPGKPLNPAAPPFQPANPSPKTKTPKPIDDPNFSGMVDGMSSLAPGNSCPNRTTLPPSPRKRAVRNRVSFDSKKRRRLNNENGSNNPSESGPSSRSSRQANASGHRAQKGKMMQYPRQYRPQRLVLLPTAATMAQMNIEHQKKIIRQNRSRDERAARRAVTQACDGKVPDFYKKGAQMVMKQEGDYRFWDMASQTWR